ncbi:MAG TPA: D-arabinono-1,4-lactone oxidase [Kofleriaceae bacterium]|nr:D-arabinono-1,4-lactone oxidase [Kofleriaceae bacterium]
MPRFVNWARTVATRPSERHAPGSEAELSELLAGAHGRRVRVVGGAHSWSRINAPEDMWVTLDRLTGVMARTESEVTVHAGTRLATLLDVLGDATLPIVGSISAQSIGGLIATGTHGSSLAHGNLSSLVTRVRLAKADGTVIELDAGDPRFEGVRVHLGALGVVTAVTLAIEPRFQLAETVEHVAIAELPAAIEAVAASAEYVKVWWMPHYSRAQVFRYERTTDATTGSPQRRRWLDDHVMHRFAFPVVARLARVPGMAPRISRVIARSFVGPRRVGPSALMLSTPMPFRHRETEAALPMTKAGEAIERLTRVVAGGDFRINFPMEIRFVKGDRAWLSPAFGADTCQIGAYCQGPAATPYFAAFWREMRALAARPHWGKELDHHSDDVRVLWPEARKFIALRDELDPERRFASDFHTRVLGP